jgi:putative membrane protein
MVSTLFMMSDMKRRTLMVQRAAWAVLALTSLAACSRPVYPPAPVAFPEPVAAQPVTPFADGGFGTRASELNRFVVEASRLAVQRSRRPAVRTLAQQLVTGHEADLLALQQIATRQGGKLPGALSTRAQTMMEDLDRSGRAYEHDYVQDMITIHQDLVGAYQAETAEGGNDDLKAFATARLEPTKRHLADLQRLSGRR